MRRCVSRREQKEKIANLEAEYKRANERLREVEEEGRKERLELESAARNLEKNLEEAREKWKEEMKESQASLRQYKDRWQKADNDAHMLRSELETVQKRLEDAIKSVNSKETSMESRYRQEIEQLELQAKTLQRELLDSKNETKMPLNLPVRQNAARRCKGKFTKPSPKEKDSKTKFYASRDARRG